MTVDTAAVSEPKKTNLAIVRSTLLSNGVRCFASIFYFSPRRNATDAMSFGKCVKSPVSTMIRSTKRSKRAKIVLAGTHWNK